MSPAEPKIRTKCPECAKEFSVPPSYLGKKATCSGCSVKFEVKPIVERVVAKVEKPPARLQQRVQAVAPQLPQQAPSQTVFSAPQTVVIQQSPGNSGIGTAGLVFSILGWLTCGLLSPIGAILSTLGLFARGSKSYAIAGLIVGFPGVLFLIFIGSGMMLAMVGTVGEAKRQAARAAERMEQEKQAIRSAAKGMLNTPVEPTSDSLDASSEVSPPTPIAESFRSPLPKVYKIGEEYKNASLSLTLKSAVIGKVPLEDVIRSNKTESEEDLLQLTLQATNLDERKILTFREANQFGPNNFRIKDDVDNVIRGVNFGFSLKVIGALKLEDIEPGKTVSHVQVFSMPPPKTEHLVLTVDLKCFGLTDEVKFLIPGSAIAR